MFFSRGHIIFYYELAPSVETQPSNELYAGYNGVCMKYTGHTGPGGEGDCSVRQWGGGGEEGRGKKKGFEIAVAVAPPYPAA